MANSTLERKNDGTLQLTITLPQPEIAKAVEQIINETVNTAEITGFRKGKAPRNLVEKTLDRGKVNEEVLRKLLPQAYIKAIDENHLRPIMNPKIHVDELTDNKDWTVQAVTCETPAIKLGNYKEAVQRVTAKSKIIIPGKEKQEPSLDEIMQVVLAETDTALPSILIEQEVDRLLSQTLDEIKKLGLTLDQYLTSTGKKPEDLRKEYAVKAEKDIKLEFALQKIAENEKIVVEDKEIAEAIQKAKDPIEKDNLQKNSYLLASILRQQKTLDFLKNL